MRFVTLITLVVIASSLLQLTIATIPPYVYGTTAIMVSGPHISARMEGNVKLSNLRPPTTIIDATPPELTQASEGTRQVSNLSSAGMGEECYAEALKHCLLTCNIIVEVRLAGKPQNGSVSVDGYAVVGDKRRDFHIAIPGIGVAYLLFTNVSCADKFKIVVANINVSTLNVTTLKDLSLFYYVYVNNDTVDIVTALQLIEQTVLTVAALVLLEVTRLKCHKYFSVKHI